MPDTFAPLVWDTIGERYFETGVEKCALYPWAGTSYGTGVAWSGITAINESPSGAEPSPLYADNIKYLNMLSAETFAATIEAYFYPREFNECNGQKALRPGMYAGQQNRKTFGLSYETKIGNDTEGNDHAYKIHIVYGCLAAPSEQNHGTVNESPEAGTFSWSVSTTPVDVPGAKPTAKMTFDSREMPEEFMTRLKEVLRGSATANARLPLPEEIVALYDEVTAGTGAEG